MKAHILGNRNTSQNYASHNRNRVIKFTHPLHRIRDFSHGNAFGFQRNLGCTCEGACPRCLTLQPKLTINAPEDKYEQEADQVADQVMGMPDIGAEENRPQLLSTQITPLVQRQAEPEEDEDDEEPVQTKRGGGKRPQVSPGLATQIRSLKGGCQPLPNSERAFFESRFNYNFDTVRIHTNDRAATLAQAIRARAYTLGNNIVFGAGQYFPHTAAGKRLLAHELTHVVQQDRTGVFRSVQRWKDELAASGFEPQFDLEMILGPPKELTSLKIDPESHRELYMYLKRLRRALKSIKPAVKQYLVSMLNQYFPGWGSQVWEDSKKPFAGYVGTRKGAKARMEKARELGLVQISKRRWKKKFIGSDVVFFSGHHFARLGFPGEFEGLDISKLQFRASRVKLVMISSCAGLAPNALRLWKKRFPNAYILGWITGSPYRQSHMMTKFLSKLPQDLILEQKSDMEDILQRWQEFVENLDKESVKLRSEKYKPRTPWGIGYATPEGKVIVYVRGKDRKWKWVTK